MNYLNNVPIKYLDIEKFHFYMGNSNLKKNTKLFSKQNVFDFFSSDTKDRFYTNLKLKKKQMWKYSFKNVEYRLNNSGYRTHEFQDIDWSNAIVLLGCSCTFGTGVNQDETLDYYLNKLTKKQVVNLGVNGISNRVMIDMLCYIINNFQTPKNIVINWTALGRFRYYFPDKFIDCGSWTSDIQPNYSNVDLESIYNNINYYETNSNMEIYLLWQIVNALASNKFNYIGCSFFPDSATYTNSKFFKNDMEARDLLHPSSDLYEECAKYIYENLK